MISLVKIFLCLLLTTESTGFISSFCNRIVKTKLSANLDEREYKYKKEYYKFLNEYDLLKINKNLLLSGSENTSIYDKVIKDRLEKYFIFESNYEKILKFNNNSNSFKLGLNQFADSYDIFQENNLMKEEIKKNNLLKIYLKQIIKNPNYYIDKYNNISSELIWNNTYISEVKDQGNCGSCWAFSTTGALEAMMRINNFNVNRLSEQELVDCSNENNGCNGGLMHLAFDYCIKNNGLVSENDYNYNASDGICKINCNKTDISNIKKVNGSNIINYKFTIPRSVIDLKASLKKGPVCIALDASPFEFRFYKEGVIDIPSSNTSSINHAVLLTGYKEYENGTYWIIQNSWGKKWGELGFAKIKITNGDGILLSQLYGVYPYL